MEIRRSDTGRREGNTRAISTGATVMGGGLSLVSPRLAAACDEASEPELRAMAEVGCRLAVARSDLNGPEVAAALAGAAALELERPEAVHRPDVEAAHAGE